MSNIHYRANSEPNKASRTDTDIPIGIRSVAEVRSKDQMCIPLTFLAGLNWSKVPSIGILRRTSHTHSWRGRQSRKRVHDGALLSMQAVRRPARFLRRPRDLFVPKIGIVKSRDLRLRLRYVLSIETHCASAVSTRRLQPSPWMGLRKHATRRNPPDRASRREAQTHPSW